MQYYYEGKDGNQQGPVSLDQLLDLNIDKSTRVWRDGMSDWDEAVNLQELELLFDEEKKATYMEQKRAANHSKFQGDKIKAKKKIWRNAIGLVLIFGVVIAVGLIITKANHNTKNDANDPSHGSGKREYQKQKMSIEDTERAYPTQFLRASGQYRGTLLGKKVVFNGHVSNSASIISYKPIKINFGFYRNNTHLGNHTEILN